MSKTGKPAAPAKKPAGTTTATRRTASATGAGPRPRAARSRLAETPLPQAPDALPAPVETPAATPAAERAPERVQWVRQSCRLTTAEYAELSLLKKRAAALARPTKRGSLLRAGLYALRGMSDAQLFALLDRLPEAQGEA